MRPARGLMSRREESMQRVGLDAIGLNRRHRLRMPSMRDSHCVPVQWSAGAGQVLHCSSTTARSKLDVEVDGAPKFEADWSAEMLSAVLADPLDILSGERACR